MSKRNPIIDADERDEADSDFATDLNDDTEDENFDDTLEELTDEDVVQEVRKMDVEQQSAVNKSRQRGRAQAAPTRQRPTPQAAAAKDRNPVRERSYEWKPTDSLDAPPARPGMEQRWIRFQIGTDEDPKNVTKKMRNYWRARTLDTVAEGFFPPTFKHSQLGTIIAVGDLMLCERPREVGVSRRKYFARRLSLQQQAGQRHVRSVEREGHEIKVTDKRDMPPSVGYGQKRRVKVQDDGE